MDDSPKSLERQKLEAEIQDAEETRERILSELRIMMDNGVRRIFERVCEIHEEASQAHLTHTQKRKILETRTVLYKDPLYKDYASHDRLRVDANRRIREATEALRVLERGEAQEAPPTTPLPKISSAVARAPLPNAGSKFSSTLLVYFYLCWQLWRCAQYV